MSQLTIAGSSWVTLIDVVCEWPVESAQGSLASGIVEASACYDWLVRAVSAVVSACSVAPHLDDERHRRLSCVVSGEFQLMSWWECKSPDSDSSGVVDPQQ